MDCHHYDLLRDCYMQESEQILVENNNTEDTIMVILVGEGSLGEQVKLYWGKLLKKTLWGRSPGKSEWKIPLTQEFTGE